MGAADNTTLNTMPDELSDSEQQYLVSWYNVGEAWIFILISVSVSYGIGTHLEIPIIVSSLRCLIQLTLMGLVLDGVLRSESIFFVMLMSLILVLLGAYELSFIQAKNTIRHLFIITLSILLISNVSIAILGTALSLQERPFWAPSKFIPVLGILLGKSMSTIAMATHQCLDTINIHGPILEAKLAMGASRYEAVKPFAIDVIRLSLLPVITQLSVIGLINIPGTMTGQLMAGSTMTDAVVYQQCTMLMITASSALGVVMAVAVR
ncbi:UPF0014 family [Fennellomyces sp. T-0311]|nr:UPF0014 family [Fennellomyces sp. T-0311]